MQAAVEVREAPDIATVAIAVVAIFALLGNVVLAICLFRKNKQPL